MATAKARAKRHKHVSKKGWEARVPAFNMLDYIGSMIDILNYFNVDVEDKVKKDLAIKHWKGQSLDVVGLDKLPDYEFAQAGALAWLIKQEAELESRDLQRLETKYIALKKKIEPDQKVVTKKTVSVQDNIEAAADKHAAEFDAAIDEFCMYANSEFDAKSYLTANNVTSVVAKRIGAKISNMLTEAEDAYNKVDEQLVEGYSLFTRPHLRKYIDFIRELINSCNVVSAQIKVTRKPRKQKEKSPAALASKVRYKSQDDNYKLISVEPSKIVGSTEAWIFNTKYRKMFKYVAMEGSTFTIRGVTIKNFDVEASCGKVVRKPEAFFADFMTANKRRMSKLFDTIKAAPGRAAGRLNEDCVIVKVF